MKRVAFVLSSGENLDIREIVEELTKRDVEVEIVAFDNDEVGPYWSQFDLIVPTPALSYTHQYDKLIKWVTLLESLGAPLANPGHVIRWNIHKSYLAQLREKGILIPVTGEVQPGSTLEQVETLLDSLDCQELVVKPMVGASGKDTFRVKIGDKEGLERTVRLAEQQELLVQEFIPQILTYGEISLIFFNGIFSHAVRKFNETGDFRIQGGYGGKVEAVEFEDGKNEIIKSFAERVLQICPFQNLLYARVDLTMTELKTGREDSSVKLPDSQTSQTPVLMELELFEPALFTEGNKDAVNRYVEAIISRFS